jgi:hypothetical protein
MDWVNKFDELSDGERALIVTVAKTWKEKIPPWWPDQEHIRDLHDIQRSRPPFSFGRCSGPRLSFGHRSAVSVIAPTHTVTVCTVAVAGGYQLSTLLRYWTPIGHRGRVAS